ncbi:MAG: thioredoxin [Candidatus Hydrogenedentes bacterium]|nr:thioredoxin [Candidatus Hydrogenedentota bacterium]
MSAVPEFTSQNFDEAVAQGVTLIDFWAEWCGPCKMIAPMIDELSAEYDGKVKVGKINIDNEPDLAVRFNVNSIPTLLIIRDGEEAKRFIGVTSKSDIAAALDGAAE